MKNIAKADSPKSAIAILPPRPFRESAKVAQTAFKCAKSDGNSFIHMVNHFPTDLGIPKMSAAATFRIAECRPSIFFIDPGWHRLIRIMFLRFNRRFKDGKEHRYWNIVESKRCAGGRVVQRQVLYLGEINDSQHEGWCRQIEAFDEG